MCGLMAWRNVFVYTRHAKLTTIASVFAAVHRRTIDRVITENTHVVTEKTLAIEP